MRKTASIIVGKSIHFLTRSLKIGGGSAAPGHYALKINPNLVAQLATHLPQNIVITGTNGKTTTARLLGHLVKQQQVKTLRNTTGSNLERGITSALIKKTGLNGQIKGVDLGIWELDEAAFNKVVFSLKPQLIVILNVLRDQLDRYGEVDNVLRNWQTALDKIDWPCTILLNANDGNLLKLKPSKTTTFKFFSVLNHQMHWEGAGHNQLPKVAVDFSAKVLKNNGLEGLDFQVNYDGKKAQFNLPIPGVYHLYDFLAAFGCFYLLNLPTSGINQALQTFAPAFGRVEKIRLEDKEGYIFLIKNPYGAAQVFETLHPEFKEGDRLLMALNDNFADGTDISWIWDAPLENLEPRLNRGQVPIICSGKRAADLALRLKYAGFHPDQLEVEENLGLALQKAKKGLKGRLFILPTYTALLELQSLLTQAGVKDHYWQEAS